MGIKVRVLYFGMLAEAVGIQEEWIDVELLPTEGKLADFFTQRFPSLATFQFTLAVNQSLCTELPTDETIDEIALLPPFAGG